MVEKKDRTLIIVGVLAAAGIAAYLLLKPSEPPIEPGYPKLICRNPYCFDVYNEAEEIQMKEFLGLDPVGADIDTYLSGLTQIQLDEWKNYWVPIWTSFNRYDVITFVNEMYNKYSQEYPKQICRDPYCFTVYNEAEEIQMNEFLGIDPPGFDIDTYLSALAQADLDYWKNYWIPVWNALMRNDIVDFVNQKYNQYSELGISFDITNFAVV